MKYNLRKDWLYAPLLGAHILAVCAGGEAWSQRTPSLYMIKAGLDSITQQKLQGMGFSRCVIVYEHDFDLHNNGQIDSAHLLSRLAVLLPDTNYAGLAVLDWEGNAYEVFRTQSPTSAIFHEYVEKYIGLLQWMKQMYPKAQWGYFGFPLTTYWWKTDSLLNRRNDALMPLLQATHVHLPILYDFYQDGSYGWLDENGYIRFNTQNSIRYGLQAGKPVYPFIWHRYHDATEKVGLRQIALPEFRNHLRIMLNQRIRKKGIDGLVWWQEDLYFAKNDERLLKEMEGTSPEEYTVEVIMKYAPVIRQELRSSGRR